MLTNSDLNKIKSLLSKLSTKDDLNNLEKRLNKKFTDLFDYLDKDVMSTKSRVSTIEKILQIAAN